MLIFLVQTECSSLFPFGVIQSSLSNFAPVNKIPCWSIPFLLKTKYVYFVATALYPYKLQISSLSYLYIYLHAPFPSHNKFSSPIITSSYINLHIFSSFLHLSFCVHQAWPISNPTWTAPITVQPFLRRRNHATAITMEEPVVAVSSESCGRFWLHSSSWLASQSSYSGWLFNPAPSSSMSRKLT